MRRQKVARRRIVACVCMLLLLCGVVAWMNRGTRKTFSGYVMQRSQGPNRIHARIASDPRLRAIASMSRHIFADECGIEVWEKIGDWSRPVLQFDVSGEDYKRFTPPAHVTITYREYDHRITVISIKQYEEK